MRKFLGYFLLFIGISPILIMLCIGIYMTYGLLVAFLLIGCIILGIHYIDASPTSKSKLEEHNNGSSL